EDTAQGPRWSMTNPATPTEGSK
ncbi:MAG: hypothetical protein RL126_67, partial [Actinomycetota bacterium]